MPRILSSCSRGSSSGISGDSCGRFMKSSKSNFSSRPVRDSRPAYDEGRPGRRWHWESMFSCIILRMGKADPYAAASSFRLVALSNATKSRSIFCTGCKEPEYLSVVPGGTSG